MLNHREETDLISPSGCDEHGQSVMDKLPTGQEKHSIRERDQGTRSRATRLLEV